MVAVCVCVCKSKNVQWSCLCSAMRMCVGVCTVGACVRVLARACVCVLRRHCRTRLPASETARPFPSCATTGPAPRARGHPPWRTVHGTFGHRGVTATRSYGSQRIFDSRYILRVNNVYNCNIATENEFQVQLEHVQLQVVLLARTSRLWLPDYAYLRNRGCNYV